MTQSPDCVMMDVFMPFYQVKNCNFGATKANATGPTGVGYALLDSGGSTISSRTTTGVYQTAPGIYGANVLFPDTFRGQILWDTGTFFSKTYYATESYNYEDNNPLLSDVYSQIISMSSSIDLLNQEVQAVSGSVSTSIAIANQSAVNAYGAYIKANQISGSLENIAININSITSSLGNFGNTMQDLYDIQFGRWHIINNQMIFYRSDNVTELVRFNLFDDQNVPSMDAVFDRVRV